ADRHLADRVPEAPGEEEDLEVESEAVDPLVAEELARGVGPVQLEAALRVVEARDDEERDHALAEAPEEPAQRRVFHVTARRMLRADHDRRAVGLLPELLELLDRDREVGVAEEDPRPRRGLDARADRRALPAADVPPDDPHA